jgi:hypothetical protein
LQQFLFHLAKQLSRLQLFSTKKSALATEALKKALELSPNTEEYEELLEESVSRQQHP